MAKVAELFCTISAVAFRNCIRRVKCEVAVRK